MKHLAHSGEALIDCNRQKYPQLRLAEARLVFRLSHSTSGLSHGLLVETAVEMTIGN
jgi:hypothetical protein